MNVISVRWPEERERVEELRASKTPRLLLVEAHEPPPICVDPLEDWIRLPANDADLHARLAALVARSTRQAGPSQAAQNGASKAVPYLDAEGLLRVNGQWVALSPVESALAGVLLQNVGVVARREDLAQEAWPAGAPTRNALDVHMLRLRRRIQPLGLAIKTVRSHGYLLEA